MNSIQNFSIREVSPAQNEGCCKGCLNAFYNVIAKICSAVAAIFRYIFCCPSPSVQEVEAPVQPIRIGDRLRPVQVGDPVLPVNPTIQVNPTAAINADNQDFLALDVETLKVLLESSDSEREKGMIRRALKAKGEDVPELVVQPPPENERIQANDQDFDLLDVATLKEILAAADDIQEKQVIKAALRKKGEVFPEDAIRPPVVQMPNVPVLRQPAQAHATPQLAPIAAAPIATAIALRPAPVVMPSVPENEEHVECPTAPMVMVRSENTSSKEQVIAFIKAEIEQDANWRINLYTQGEINVPVNHRHEQGFGLIRKNCDLLTQDDWINILNTIDHTQHPAPVIRIENSWNNQYSLKESAIKEGLQKDREVILKQRLAYLATVWVEAKYPNQAYRRDMDPSHPFYPLYKALRTNNGQGEETLIAFQALIRFLPLIKAFAAEKKEISAENQDLEARKLNVNYLLDSVLTISCHLTGLIIHNIQGPSRFNEAGSNTKSTVYFKELDSDKIANGADTLWNAYLKASANEDMAGFIRAFDGLCFDARMSSLNEYSKKFAQAGHPDFTLKTQDLNGDTANKVGEYYRVFLNEQMALYCQKDEPNLEPQDFIKKYEEFSRKTLAARGTTEAQKDPIHMAFFKDYITVERFKSWSKLIRDDYKDQYGRHTLPAITEPHWYNGEDPTWTKTLETLETLAIDFEP